MNRFSGQDIKTELEIFKANIDLPHFSNSTKIQSIIDNLSTYSKLDPEKLSEYAMDISLYGLYLLQEENKLVATINWCESNIKIIIGQEAQNYGGTWYEEKKNIIVANNKTALQLDSLRTVAQVKLDSIKYMSQKLQYLADSLKRYSFEKRKINDESY